MADHRIPLPTPADSERTSRIRDVQRRLTVLKIEQHRLLAEFARLRAEGEDEAADQLEARLRENEHELANLAGDSLLEAELRGDGDPDPAALVERQPHVGDKTRYTLHGAHHRSRDSSSAKQSGRFEQHDQRTRGEQPERVRHTRWTRPALLVSLLSHALLLAPLGLVGFATLQDNGNFLLASAVESDESFDDFVEISLDPLELEELQLTPEDLELAASVEEEILEPLESATLGEAADSLVAIDAMPIDAAGLMAGAATGSTDGMAGAGRQAGNGKVASAKFFGAEARGDRFVFVVDNSGTMKEGRMETTMLELLKCVGGMQPHQEFHVLFFSDQVYPMFYPEPVLELLPVTRDNLARLEQWLTTVEMAAGNEIDAAVEFAATLNPNVVYLLGDGDSLLFNKGGQLVKSRRLRVITEKAGERPFVVHTLGMTVRDRTDAQALSLIAESHRGTFTPVGLHPAALRLSQQRQIPYHSTRGPVWGSKVD